MRTQKVEFSPFKNYDLSVYIRREDENDPLISGNKFWKLKYNLDEAKKQGHKTLLTFGGAYSNHIVATAAAGKKHSFKTIGIIRGDELAITKSLNHTLQLAQSLGMKLFFESRNNYHNKHLKELQERYKNMFGEFYLIPEGGTNELAVRGCQEILGVDDGSYEVICCPVGTGGTLAGLSMAALPHQKVIGFTALKGNFLKDEINKWTHKNNWELQSDYHFGGYAKVTAALIHFINDFYDQTKIPLDPIYMGKMIFGLVDMIQKKQIITKKKLLIIHTGGLQGITGMNSVLKRKNLPLIAI